MNSKKKVKKVKKVKIDPIFEKSIRKFIFPLDFLKSGSILTF